MRRRHCRHWALAICRVMNRPSPRCVLSVEAWRSYRLRNGSNIASISCSGRSPRFVKVCIRHRPFLPSSRQDGPCTVLDRVGNETCHGLAHAGCVERALRRPEATYSIRACGGAARRSISSAHDWGRSTSATCNAMPTPRPPRLYSRGVQQGRRPAHAAQQQWSDLPRPCTSPASTQLSGRSH